MSRVKHNKFGYYCISCYDRTKKKYYLKEFKNKTEKAWRCPHCNHRIIDWALKQYWEGYIEKLKARKMSVSRINNNKKRS